MKIQLLQNPLSKGEKWEKKDKREIEITQSGDNRGMKPNVYFSILTPAGKSMKIAEDIFIPTEVAIQIGKQLIKEAQSINKEWGKLLKQKSKPKPKERLPKATLSKDRKYLTLKTDDDKKVFERISKKEFNGLSTRPSISRLTTDRFPSSKSKYWVALLEGQDGTKKYYFTNYFVIKSHSGKPAYK